MITLQSKGAHFSTGITCSLFDRNRVYFSGVVYRARDKVTGDIVALKRCLPHHEASDGFPLTTLREITLLRELQNGGEQNGIVILKDVAVSSR